MEIEESAIELFEKYLNRSLEMNQVKDFEKKIETDRIFSEMFSAFKSAQQAITGYGRKKLKHKLSVIMHEEEENRFRKPAKGLALKKMLSEIFDEFFIPYENILTTRSHTEKDEVLFKAMSVYSKGDYKEASVMFKHLVKTYPENLIIYFYYGICELILGNYENSKKLFKKIIINNRDFLKELASWYLALTYLKSGNLKLAEKQFKSLMNTGKFKDSEKILQKITSL